ncbi:MAG: hybrid sensor histidine kinase/response regulator [Deferrisomatales bacterium]
MTLRTRLLVPLGLFSLALGAYLFGFWMPRSLAAAEAQYRRSGERHLATAAEQLVPLLLGHQLDTVYQNLDTLLAKNEDWLSIELWGPAGRPVYPLDPPRARPEGGETRVLEEPIRFLGEDLGTLRVRIDFGPTLARIRSHHRQLMGTLAGTLALFLAVAAATLEGVVRRPLAALAAASARLARGDFGGALPRRTGDEVGVLVGSFEEMRDSIRAAQTGLWQEVEEHRRSREALRVSEQEYRDLVDRAPVGIFRAAPSGELRFANPALAAMLEYDRPEELCGLHLRALEADPPEQGWWLEALGEGGRLEGAEVAWRGRQGRVRQLLLSASRDGEGAAGMVHDITDRRRLEEEMLRREKLESVGVLAGGIAHDFNNLLTAILANVDLAAAYAAGNDRVGQRLADAVKAALRARDLTQQLLTFSRGGTPVKRVTSLPEVVREAAEFALRGTPCRCDFGAPAELWPAEIDPGQVSQVIQNVVLNAVQAMPDGGVVAVRCGNVTAGEAAALGLAPSPHVRVSIADQGPGIPADLLPRIFDPYFTTKAGGSGLGLATSYSIVRNHGGQLAAGPAPGGGAEFRLHLPASPRSHAPPSAHDATPAPGTGRVLVMDDEAAVREAVGESLCSLGYEVALAADGAEAVETFRASAEAGRPFDLVLLDLTVPGGMGGVQALQELVAQAPGVRAVASSGYARDPVLASPWQYGFVGVLPKPYTRAELARAVAAARTPGPAGPGPGLSRPG